MVSRGQLSGRQDTHNADFEPSHDREKWADGMTVQTLAGREESSKVQHCNICSSGKQRNHKATLSMPLWLARAAPATGPSPGMMLRTPGGTPASSASSPTRSALSGVCSATWHVTAHAGTCQSRCNMPKGNTHWPQHTLANGTCFQRTPPRGHADCGKLKQ